MVEGHFVDLLLLVAVGRLYTSWSTIHLPKRGVLVRSKSAVRFELALLGAEIFTFKVVTFKAYLTLSLPWLMTKDSGRQVQQELAWPVRGHHRWPLTG